jgi:DNA (cytosine-5)-methyltransferase 1
MSKLTMLELCAGGGGQALGLEEAGLDHVGLVELDPNACRTLRHNRPTWNVFEADIRKFDARPFRGVDVVVGGLPCPPFSIAGKQLGASDERNLFPAALHIIETVKPRAVIIENVRGILDAVFDDFRNHIAHQLGELGYLPQWKLLNAFDFGVPQLRPRVIFVALKAADAYGFTWPESSIAPPTVGEAIFDLISANGWRGAALWRERANEIAPTIVGGSHKHGGPDLGPTRARNAWASLGVDGLGIANDAPGRDFVGMPRLTLRMVARLQGFPDEWHFCGAKTAAYRQIGNAFPPPVANAVGRAVQTALAVRALAAV